MWQTLGLVLLLSEAGALRASDSRQTVTPVKKVATLLLKIRDKVQADGKNEAEGYDKFACFCKEEADNKVFYIDKSNTLISELQASIDSLGGDVTKLDGEVVTTKADLLKAETEANASAVAGAAEGEAHRSKRANLTEGIDVITKAIEHLRTTREDVTNVKATAMLTKTRKALEGFGLTGLQVPGDAPVYEYKSGDVIAVLMGLSQTFKAERARADQEYGLVKHDRDMTDGVRFQKMKAFQDDIALKEKISAFKTEEKVKKEAVRDEETTAMNRDQAYLDELTSTCTSKAAAWDERSRVRAEEITAITQAAKILQGIEGKYEANSKLVGLQRASAPALARTVKRHTVPALIQLRGGAGPLAAVVRFLSGRGDALHSSKIAALAQSLRATAALAQVARSAPVDGTAPVDHFVEVRSIIKDLVAKLEAEALNEATAKSLCDDQMKSAVTKRDERVADMETAGAGMDETDAAIHGLTNDIATMSGELADMHKALLEMTELRAEEKARNEKTIADAEEGVTGIEQASELLQDFYEANEGFLQTAPASTTFFPKGGDRTGRTFADGAPTLPDASESWTYNGQQAESKGIFGLLAVIKSDFERTADVVGGNEKAAAEAFAHDSKLLNQNIDLKEQDKTTAEGDKETKEGELISLKEDKKTATELHGKALEELEKLRSSCVDGEESWEERKANRKKEIEALKQAHQMLEDWKN